MVLNKERRETSLERRVPHQAPCRRSAPGRGNSKCRGPEVGEGVARNQEGAHLGGLVALLLASPFPRGEEMAPLRAETKEPQVLIPLGAP